MEYGRKMQKLLQSRHSDSSESKMELIPDHELKELEEFKSEMKIRLAEVGDSSNSKGAFSFDESDLW